MRGNVKKSIYTLLTKCHYRNNSSHDQPQEDGVIPISSIEFDYKPNSFSPPDTQVEEGNLFTNMEKMIEVWKRLEQQEGRHPKMVDVDIVGGGGDINSLDLDIEQLKKISTHSKLSRSSISDLESDGMIVPASNMENGEKEEKEEKESGLIENPNTILQESGWRPLVLGTVPEPEDSEWRPA